MEKVQIFQDKKVRTHWDAEKEEWYFSVVDVVGVLTDSINPTDYLKKMRKRDPQGGLPYHSVYSIAQGRTVQAMVGNNSK